MIHFQRLNELTELLGEKSLSPSDPLYWLTLKTARLKKLQMNKNDYIHLYINTYIQIEMHYTLRRTLSANGRI